MGERLVQSEECRDDNGPKICHIALPCITKVLPQCANSIDWFDFVLMARRRIKSEKNVEKSNWYRPRHQIERLHVCEVCFLDKITTTPYKSEFELVDGKEIKLPSGGYNCCSLSLCPISVAWENAVTRGDYGVFWNAANTILKSPPCEPEGITDGAWYTIQGGNVDLNICQACYAGIISPFGMDQFFELGQRDNGTKILCDLNLAAPRFPMFARKLSQAVNLGDFRIFSDHVRRLTGVPVCPRREALRDATWYAIGECPVCPECYVGVVAHTGLGQRLSISKLDISCSTLCSMYSLSMRRKWSEACASNNVNHFIAAARHRAQIYFETVPVIDRIKQTKAHLMADAVNDGDSEVGWHQTEDGAESARLTDSMNKKTEEAQRKDDWLLIELLEKRWSEVE
ncbi:hypothetical protein F5B20DRAFT_558621 [Whalleya microplaca]|nr:hypothetical protein F5B20DRAFT_558621 [Whalleya microplaca]